MPIVASTTDSLLTILERFNRKERFILFEQAAAGAGRVILHEDYRRSLGEEIGQDIPNDALVMMDYHLNWLYAALELASGSWSSRDVKPRSDVPTVSLSGGKDRSALERNQEDIDLLVAWQQGSVTHLALVEAKAYSGWTNRQMRSKAARLEAIFSRSGSRYEGVVPHFALTSFKEPTGLSLEGWPLWMLTEGAVAHVALATPKVPRLTVGEVEASGSPSTGGGHFAIRE